MELIERLKKLENGRDTLIKMLPQELRVEANDYWQVKYDNILTSKSDCIVTTREGVFLFDNEHIYPMLPHPEKRLIDAYIYANRELFKKYIGGK